MALNQVYFLKNIFMKKFEIVTIFPQIFDSYFGESIIGRARQKKLIEINTHDLRGFAQDNRITSYNVCYTKLLRRGLICSLFSLLTVFSIRFFIVINKYVKINLKNFKSFLFCFFLNHLLSASYQSCYRALRFLQNIHNFFVVFIFNKPQNQNFSIP